MSLQGDVGEVERPERPAAIAHPRGDMAHGTYDRRALRWTVAPQGTKKDRDTFPALSFWGFLMPYVFGSPTRARTWNTLINNQV